MGGGSQGRAGREWGAGVGPGRQCSDQEGRPGLVLLGREAGDEMVQTELAPQLPACPLSLTLPIPPTSRSSFHSSPLLFPPQQMPFPPLLTRSVPTHCLILRGEGPHQGGLL